MLPDSRMQKVENRLFRASCGMELACLWRHCRNKARNPVGNHCWIGSRSHLAGCSAADETPYSDSLII